MSSAREKSDEIGHRTVTDASVMTFGCLTGDYAQMHFDHEFGHAAGMGGPIAHGLLSAAWSLGALAQHAPERLGLGDPRAYLAGFRVRFSRMVHIGDRFSLRWNEGAGPAGEGADGAGLDGLATLDTDFEVLNQRGEVATRGGVSVCRARAGGAPAFVPAPAPMEVEAWSLDAIEAPLGADDMLGLGPRGVSAGRTLTEADLVAYASFTGELNPLYLNEEFARTSLFGARIAPPMLTFCLGFGDYVRDLLRVPMPSAGFAGHLGDAWRFFAPAHVGDTLRVRHKPIACAHSKSRPGMAIVHFALQLENQRNEIVQDGRVAMMMSAQA